MSAMSQSDLAAHESFQRVEHVEHHIHAITEAGERVALAHAVVMQLEDERPLIKARCIEAMIGSPNPLGKLGATHSASSAEAVVEQHADYWQHRRKQDAAEVERWRSLAAYEAAKLMARLSVEAYAAHERTV